jgi:hypothetical protein
LPLGHIFGRPRFATGWVAAAVVDRRALGRCRKPSKIRAVAAVAAPPGGLVKRERIPAGLCATGAEAASLAAAPGLSGRGDETVFHDNFTLRKLQCMAHSLKPNWRTRMLDGLGIKLLEFPSDWLPGRPLTKRALHQRLISLASLIVISLLSLGLWVAISEAVISIAVR